MLQHEISKRDLRQTRWADQPLPPLTDGTVRLKIDAFALTANNVTYAAFGGPPMHYWNFFPATDPAFGRVPVWGFASVIDSRAPGITVGQRVYGYLPMAETLTIEAVRISERGFMDGADHRAGLAPIYNTYSFTSQDPAYQAAYEAQQMLFRPLYLTGWMICDSLMHAAPAPQTVIISSASSKTALAAAHALRAKGVARLIGLTSPANRAFVTASGLYHETVAYDDVTALSISAPAAYVDFVGRPALTAQIHAVAGPALVRSLIIGVTDWEGDRTPPASLTGPTPEFFFVPDYASARAKDFAPGELERQMGGDLLNFYPASTAFVTPQAVHGADAIAQAWQDTVDAKIAPDRGLICSF